jgi:MFS family permease
MLGAQLMIILDATVVNIALPHIQNGLHFSPTSLSWVMNGYTLTFGGLLLLGGRAGDILGRRRMFIAGLTIFTLASLAGGLATTAGMLLAARATQGVGGALASPAVLALVVSSFPEGRERVKALAIYSAVVTGGSSLGLVLGGLITEWLSWRWVLFINVPIGIAVIAITPLFVSETKRQPGKFDLTGAITSTAGIGALVYGFIRAASNGWGDTVAIGSFVVAAALLALFLFNEKRAAQPITPLRLFADKSRSGSFVARLLLVAGMMGMFFFLTQFLQDVLGFSPIMAGVAFLPMTVTLFAVSRAAPRLIPRFGPKPLMIAGMLPVIAGNQLLVRRVPGDDAVRPGHGRRVRAADHGLAGRGQARGVRRRLQHGQRHAAGRRRARPGGAGRGLRHREPQRRRAPDRRPVGGRPAAPRAGARHVGRLRAGRHLRRGHAGALHHRDPRPPAQGRGAGLARGGRVRGGAGAYRVAARPGVAGPGPPSRPSASRQSRMRHRVSHSETRWRIFHVL